MTGASAQLVLLAGPSGSGKSRLANAVGALTVRLDDFYRDFDHPGLPRTLGIVDWDDAASWDAEGAVEALGELLRTGRTTVPRYSIVESRRIGSHELTLADERVVIAEGIFAIELLAHVRAAGLDVDPVYLDRNRNLVTALRLRRDLAQKRKTPLVLVRRGWALRREQPNLKRRALTAGFRPLTMRAAISLLG